MSNLTFNPKNHRYELDGKPMTGVTTILNVIAKNMLIGWAAKQSTTWIRLNCLKSGTAGLDDAIYEATEENLKEAENFHTKKKENAGERGTDVHALVEKYIKYCIENNKGIALGIPQWERAFQGQETGEVKLPDPMLKAFGDWAILNNIRFLASEKQVYSRDLWFAGTADFTFEKDGKRYVGDLKTMKKMWDRVPFFQTAGYMIALEEMGEDKYDGSCIVNINKETTELTDYWTYDHDKDKEAFKAALVLYRQLSNF